MFKRTTAATFITFFHLRIVPLHYPEPIFMLVSTITCGYLVDVVTTSATGMIQMTRVSVIAAAGRV